VLASSYNTQYIPIPGPILPLLLPMLLASSTHERVIFIILPLLLPMLLAFSTQKILKKF
jgi:hypothetical protein